MLLPGRNLLLLVPGNNSCYFLAGIEARATQACETSAVSALYNKAAPGESRGSRRADQICRRMRDDLSPALTQPYTLLIQRLRSRPNQQKTEFIRLMRRWSWRSQRPRKIARGRRCPNYPPRCPNLAICPNDLSLDPAPEPGSVHPPTHQPDEAVFVCLFRAICGYVLFFWDFACNPTCFMV